VPRATELELHKSKTPGWLSEGFVGGCSIDLRATEMGEPSSNRTYGYSKRLSRSTRMVDCNRARHRRVGAPRRVGHFPSEGKASDRRPRMTTSSWETRTLFPRRHVSVTAGGGMGTRKKSQPSYSPSRVVPRGCPVVPLIPKEEEATRKRTNPN
jgi:hypothetical protein